MTSENELANDLGSWAYISMTQLFCLALGYGLSLPIFIFSVIISRRRMRRNGITRIFALLTVGMFVSVTILVIIVSARVFLSFSWALRPVTTDSPSLEERLSERDPIDASMVTAEIAFQTFNFIAGDAVVILRACQMWPHSKTVHWCLWILLVLSFGTSLANLVISARTLNLSLESAEIPAYVAQIDSASMFASLACNLAATTCIIVRAWILRKDFNFAFGGGKNASSNTVRALRLLIECGFLFSVIQLLNAVLTIFGRDSTSNIAPISLAYAALGPLCTVFTGVYPSIIILVFAFWASPLDQSFPDSSMWGRSEEKTDCTRRSSVRFSTIQFAASSEQHRPKLEEDKNPCKAEEGMMPDETLHS